MLRLAALALVCALLAPPHASAQQPEAAAISLRKAFAKEVDGRFLDAGFDIKISTDGPGHTILRLRTPLAGRVMIHHMKKTTFFKECKSLGIKRVVLSDGLTEAWNIDID